MMKKIIHDTLCLVVITLVAGVCLAFAHEITADPIAKAEAEERAASYRRVYPEAKDFSEIGELSALCEKASPDFAAGVTVKEALSALDENGNVLGCVVSVTSANGYGGDIVMSLGVSGDGTITGFTVTAMSETPSLGAYCTEDWFADQFKGISAPQIRYTKDGRTEPDQIDAISGATRTTKAVTEAVNGGLRFAQEYFTTLVEAAGGAENE